MLLLPRDVTDSTRFLQYADGIRTLKSEYNSLKVLRCPILRVIPNNIPFSEVSQASPSCPSDKSSINALHYASLTSAPDGDEWSAPCPGNFPSPKPSPVRTV